MGQFNVEASELRSAAKAIKDSVGKSDKVKLDGLGDTSSDFGHGDAAKEFGQLMATWMEAIKSPMKEDGENSADKLDENAESYEGSEQQSQNHFKGPEVAGPGPIHSRRSHTTTHDQLLAAHDTRAAHALRGMRPYRLLAACTGPVRP